MPESPEDFRDLNDSALVADCRWDAFRGSGPGGQKRNKTSSSVRLTHLPTGLSVLAGESRSQVENKSRALRRLKMRLALEFRRPIDPHAWEPPAWIDQIRTRPAKSRSVQYRNAPANLSSSSALLSPRRSPARPARFAARPCGECRRLTGLEHVERGQVPGRGPTPLGRC